MSIQDGEHLLYKTVCCPMCNSDNAAFHSRSRSNRYSEEIAKYLNLHESVLLASVENLICDECGLIYKSHWFDSTVLSTLFNELIPHHPRGWDTISGRFSADTFYNELALYGKALDQSDVENINRYRRALTSIIDSIRSDDLKFDRELAQKNIENGVLDYFNSNASAIHSSFGKPEPFKRFSGHASEDLWKHVNSIAKPIHRYAEIGCPMWGMYSIAVESGVAPVYVNKSEVNFWSWSEKCSNEGVSCLRKCNSIIPNLEVINWDQIMVNKVDLMGVYQYIDHLEKPREFFRELFERTKAVVAVIDDADHSPSYIQHFTGWTPRAIRFVAETFGKLLDESFLASQKAGHRTFIFY